MIRCQFGPGDQVNIQADHAQHLSRLTHAEAKDLVIQLLVFGGNEFRDAVKHWLNGGKLDELGHFLTDEHPAVR